MWKQYFPATVLVNDVPDLSNLTKLHRVESLIRDFETLPLAIGPKSTNVWLRPYRAYLNNLIEQQVPLEDETVSKIEVLG